MPHRSGSGSLCAITRAYIWKPAHRCVRSRLLKSRERVRTGACFRIWNRNRKTRHPVKEVRAMYFGEVNDGNIRHIFRDAGDFIVRSLRCGRFTLYAYAIDGLTSGADTSEYVVKPISEQLRGDSIQELYTQALRGGVYNSVADPCRDLDTVAMKLVNGFCVILFP